MTLSEVRRPKSSICMIVLALAAAFPSTSGAEDGKATDGRRAPSEAAGPPPVGDRGEIEELKRQIARQQQQLSEQQKQLEELRLMLLEQHKLLAGAPADPRKQAAAGAPTPPSTQLLGQVASTAPVIPAAAAPAPALPKTQEEATRDSSPLSFHIGSAYITPLGFMDFTGVWRSTAPGTGIGTNFGSIPFGNTTQGNLTELRLSTQNSRIGARVDAIVKGARILAYWESDFLGLVPGNAAVSSNSDSLRLRLFWVDVRKKKWEILGGQSWSMITPGREGISPLPANIFNSQDIDVNYQLGLTWSRNSQLRFVFHPSDTVAMGLSLESPEQYIGGSGGGGLITLPADLATPYASQLNNGGTTFSAPGLHPDIIGRIAFDPKLPNGRAFHLEIGGMARTFKVWNPLSGQSFRAPGIGGQLNLNVELFKGFHFLSNNFWGDGGGRWIFGQSPDLIVRSDGSLSPMHSGSTVTGFEYTPKNTLLYAYYGGVYIGRNVAVDASNGKFVGYGYPGSPNTQNRTIQEATFGLTQTLWKDPRYGALIVMGQYSYLLRNPWAVASGEPARALANMVFLNLRYALPGSAPKLE